MSRATSTNDSAANAGPSLALRQSTFIISSLAAVIALIVAATMVVWFGARSDTALITLHPSTDSAKSATEAIVRMPTPCELGTGFVINSISEMNAATTPMEYSDEGTIGYRATTRRDNAIMQGGES